MGFEEWQGQGNLKTPNLRIACPDDILKLASYDPAVAAYVALWHKGEISWEAMILTLVIHLATVNKKQLDTLVELSTRLGPIKVEHPQGESSDQTG